MLWSLQKHFKCTTVNILHLVHQNFIVITGNKPPGVIPNKFMYMSKDLTRAAEYFDVPLQFPSDPFEVMFKKGTRIWSSELNWRHQVWISSLPHLPPGSLSAMRFVTAVQEQEKGGDKLVEQVSRELWRRIWSEDKDITEAASLAEVPAGPAWFCLESLISDSDSVCAPRQPRRRDCLTARLKTRWRWPPRRRSKTSWKGPRRRLWTTGSVQQTLLL